MVITKMVVAVATIHLKSFCMASAIRELTEFTNRVVASRTDYAVHKGKYFTYGPAQPLPLGSKRERKCAVTILFSFTTKRTGTA
jgi:hypothetical protein